MAETKKIIDNLRAVEQWYRKAANDAVRAARYGSVDRYRERADTIARAIERIEQLEREKRDCICDDEGERAAASGCWRT